MQDRQDQGEGVGPADPTDLAGPADPTDPTDPLLSIRTELDGVDELPLEARAEVFERTHRIVVDELRALELG